MHDPAKIDQLVIAACTDSDVDTLDAALPHQSPDSPHRWRYDRQQRGESTFLVGWLAGQPVGKCEVIWTGCAATEVRAAIGICPEVNGLDIWPEAHRSHGYGSQLIDHAEQLAVDRGLAQIGLGVDHTNDRALALYRRLGYQPTIDYPERYSYRDMELVPHQVTDRFTFLVKSLPTTIQ